MRGGTPVGQSGEPSPGVAGAMSLLPGGVFLMSSAFDGKRTGLLARSVQPCADVPPLVAVAVRKGHAIAPVIRDSHRFALSLLSGGQGRAIRAFELKREEFAPPDAEEDPFDGFETQVLVTGCPVLTGSPVVLDCEVVRHLDLESDHEIYVGLVIAGRHR